MRKGKSICIGLLLFLLTAGVAFAAPSDYSVGRWVVSAGNGELSSASYVANGVIGEPATGTSSSTSYVLRAGFAASMPQKTPLRVTAGAIEPYTDAEGHLWKADQPYIPGFWGFYGEDNIVDRGTDHEISGTDDDRVYQTERYGLSGYRFDLRGGTYDVVLHFAETYRTGPGQRIFDVMIEGKLVLDDLDIYSEVGGDAALSKTFCGIIVNDRQLNIEFVESIERSEINGIEILAPLPGDANGDRAIDGRDVIRCKKIILGLEGETEGADANEDDIVDGRDVIRIKKMILGIE